MHRRTFVVALPFVFAFPPIHRAEAAAASTPREVVERLESTLISVMSSAQKLGYAGRYKRLKPVVEETHDLAAIAQLTVGSAWNDFTPDQRKRFVDAFSELSLATYADRFDGYAGETFKLQSERKLESGDVLVQSVLAEPRGGTTRFDYVLRQNEGRWAIVNIIVDGVSDLAIKRAEYSGIVKKQGAEALIAMVKAKPANYGKGK